MISPSKTSHFPRMKRLRFNVEDRFAAELYCYWCEEWWPITPDYWESQKNGSHFGVFNRCAACQRDQRRVTAIVSRARSTRGGPYSRPTYALRDDPALLAAWQREQALREVDRQAKEGSRQRKAGYRAGWKAARKGVA